MKANVTYNTSVLNFTMNIPPYHIADIRDRLAQCLVPLLTKIKIARFLVKIRFLTF